MNGEVCGQDNIEMNDGVVCGQDRIRRITIPVDKLKDFIVLLFGTEHITLKENHFSITKVLDLTNTNVAFRNSNTKTNEVA